MGVVVLGNTSVGGSLCVVALVLPPPRHVSVSSSSSSSWKHTRNQPPLWIHSILENGPDEENSLPFDKVTDVDGYTKNKSQGKGILRGVTLKMAFDQNGGVANAAQIRQEQQSVRFTCGESLDMVHRLRRDSDAVLVGRTTVEIDDCTLTVRRVHPRQNGENVIQPTRVVIDPYQTLLPNCDRYKIFTDGLPTIIYHLLLEKTSYDDPKKNEDDLSDDSSKPRTVVVETMDQYPNVQWIGLPGYSRNDDDDLGSDDGSSRNLSVQDILEDLSTNRNIHHVMVEGGPATAKVFLHGGIVDRAIFVYAPMKFEIPIPSNLSHEDFVKAGLQQIRQSDMGVDHVEYWIRPDLVWPQVNDIEGTVDFWP